MTKENASKSLVVWKCSEQKLSCSQ